MFAPSLFIGAMLGSAYGAVVHLIAPGVAGPAGAYALVGMGAVFAGAARAPITAVIILFELTGRIHDHPAAHAGDRGRRWSLQSLLMADTIYTPKLRRRGIDPSHTTPVPATPPEAMANSVMQPPPEPVPHDLPLAAAARTLLARGASMLPVASNDKIIGVITARGVSEALTDEDAADLTVESVTEQPPRSPRRPPCARLLTCSRNPAPAMPPSQTTPADSWAGSPITACYEASLINHRRYHRLPRKVGRRGAARIVGAVVGEAAIEARSLTKSYSLARGIVDVDLRVEPGQVFGLVGANGAGKTTFMRTLLDFIRPTSGTVSVFGRDSSRESVSVRRITTYLPGELVIPPRLNGWEAVRRFTFARGDIDRARIEGLADRLDLDLSRKVGDLSKGNKQKVGLVLAFAPRSRLLVLDEPTSGLDPLLQREFVALVAEWTADGATVLLSSHDMPEVEQIADRVALMREGRIQIVDDLAAITSRARRRGRATPRSDADLQPLAAALAMVPGVSAVEVDDGAVCFVCAGDMNAVVKSLAAWPMRALDIAHADLEDAFFSAYDQATTESAKTS